MKQELKWDDGIIFGALLLIFLFKLIRSKGSELSSPFQVIIEDLNHELLNFCAFMESFTHKGQENNQEKEQFCQEITKQFCRYCQKNKECLQQNKGTTFLYFQTLFEHGEYIFDAKRSAYAFNCLHIHQMAVYAHQWKQKHTLQHANTAPTLELNGVSNSIRQYLIELIEIRSSTFQEIIEFQKELIHANIAPKLYEPKLYSNKKFSLKIGLPKRKNSSIIMNSIYQMAQTYFKTEELSITRENSENQYFDYFTLTNKKLFRVIYEHASLAKNNHNISGDNYIAQHTDDHTFICAISDGMGSGYTAYQQSKETLELVEKIGRCSITTSTALTILNTFYSLQAQQESFATLDLFSFDLTTGKASFYKVGATSTFLIKNDVVLPIRNENLPIGAGDTLTTKEHELTEGDLVIMVSDGVTEHFDEQKLIRYLSSLTKESPQKIVYDLLQKVYYENNQYAHDDMTAIAIKISHL